VIQVTQKKYKVVKGQERQLPAIGTTGFGVYVPFNGDPATTPRVEFIPDDLSEWPDDEDFGAYIMSPEDLEEIDLA
jgi:hypothetical protein